MDFHPCRRLRHRRRISPVECRLARTLISTSKIFDDVVGLITSNYVEKVDIDKVMDGAMNGLTESLDPDSAFLTASEVKQAESSAPMPAGDVGLDLTRQYYTRA